jgi:3-keto-5-aminohexanoate cleavage enzyme
MSNLSEKPCIICVAITGSVPTKANNPAVPISVTEQIESTHEAFEAGATICHAHVRNDDQTPSSDPEKFAALKEGLLKHCPGMIIQFSTGGRSGAGQARGGMLPLSPDMASLSVGSNNFPTRVYENPPDLVDWLASEMRTFNVKPEIEAFDLSHIHQAVKMNRDGRIPGKLYVQFVMGVKNAMPVDRDVFDYYIKTVERLAPDAQWCDPSAAYQHLDRGAGHQCGFKHTDVFRRRRQQRRSRDQSDRTTAPSRDAACKTSIRWDISV